MIFSLPQPQERAASAGMVARHLRASERSSGRLSLRVGADVAWVRLDDHIDENPKIQKASPLGFALFVAGLAYCNRNMTDGFIPWSAARGLLSWQFLDGDFVKTIAVTCGLRGDDVVSDMVIALLLQAGLWEQSEGGYRVHDYEKYQPSREEILKQRARKAKNVADFRNRVCNRVTNRAPDPDPVRDRSVVSSTIQSDGTAPRSTRRSFKGKGRKPGSYGRL